MLCGIILGIGILCVSNYRVIHINCRKIAASFFNYFIFQFINILQFNIGSLSCILMLD